MNKKLKSLSFTLFIICMLPNTAFTQADPEAITPPAEQAPTSILPMSTKTTPRKMNQPHIGIFGGVSDPVENDYDPSVLTAVEVGYYPFYPFGISAEVLTEKFEHDNKSSLTRNQFMFKASYNLGGDVPVIQYSYLGLGVGIVYEDRNETTPSYLGVMPNLGFDIPLSSSAQFVSLGANLRATVTSSNEADSYSLNGVVKFWF